MNAGDGPNVRANQPCDFSGLYILGDGRATYGPGHARWFYARRGRQTPMRFAGAGGAWVNRKGRMWLGHPSNTLDSLMAHLQGAIQLDHATLPPYLCA